jgi:Protein of unknown function (DUF4058)
MPLRDHFEHPARRNWEKIHGMWPAVMVQHLVRILPPRYHIAPQVRLSQFFSIDIAVHDTNTISPNRNGHPAPGLHSTGGGVATAVWAPPDPVRTIELEIPKPDEYEVRILDADDDERLVAVIELVSPSNKDRPESRRAFVAKCVALLEQDVSVSIVDLVTVRQFNLYADVLDFLGMSDPALGSPVPHLYASTIHRRWSPNPNWIIDTWARGFAVGDPLPALPIWLVEGEGTMLDLEGTYEETCRTLRLVN